MSYEVEAAVFFEQRVPVAVVAVQPQLFEDPDALRRTRASLCPTFRGCHVVLMSQATEGTPEFFGRPDIVGFLSDTPWS